MGIVEEAHNLRVVGEGKRGVIVLAHGFGTDQSVWKHLVPHLVADYRVVLFDTMGAGPTNPDYFDFSRYATLEGYALDLLAILEELGMASCIYVGHSVSAVIGVLASISRPDLFSKLVLLSASPRENWLEEGEGTFDGAEENWGWTWVFLWRLARHSIPTAQLLHHRNMSTMCVCSLWGAEDTC
ncbi:hypothetical protein ACQJBY_032739 [Aegilops geniculata]